MLPDIAIGETFALVISPLLGIDAVCREDPVENAEILEDALRGRLDAALAARAEEWILHLSMRCMHLRRTADCLRARADERGYGAFLDRLSRPSGELDFCPDATFVTTQ